MASFPGSLASFTGFTSSHTLAADSHAAQHNLEQGEILAVQTKVGTGSSTPTSGTVLRGNGTGTSTWAQVALTTDVTGVLPTQNGGTGQNSLTSLTLPSATLATPAISNPTITAGGSWAGSPTLTTPTIANFSNATHNHSGASSGGLINTTSLTNTVNSGSNGGSAGGTTNYMQLGSLYIVWGRTAAISVAGSQQVTAVLNYPVTFQAAPVITTSTTAETTETKIRVGNSTTPSTTSVTFEVVTTTAVNAPGGTTVTIDWIAIGV